MLVGEQKKNTYNKGECGYQRLFNLIEARQIFSEN